MKIVVLTARLQSPQVGALCRALADVGLPVSDVVCARHPAQSAVDHWLANNAFVRKMASRLRRGAAIQPSAPVLGELRRQGTRYRMFTGLFHAMNVVSHLRRLAPDLLINCQGPIFRTPTIETARLGLLNCHTALLPEFRGMHVAEWSVLHGYPTGSTIHFIDPGVDTGRILRFFEVPVSDCRTVEQMRNKLVSLQWEHMAAAARLLVDGEIEPVEQRVGEGRQYFRMHGAIEARVEHILAAGYRGEMNVADRPYVCREY